MTNVKGDQSYRSNFLNSPELRHHRDIRRRDEEARLATLSNANAKTTRCHTCGDYLQFQHPCPRHPGAERIEWNPKLEAAYQALCASTIPDAELDDAVDAGRAAFLSTASTAFPVKTKQPTNLDFAVVLACARRWQRPDFTDRLTRGRRATAKDLFG